MPNIKPERVLSYKVTHPQHPTQLVSLINPKRDDIFALATTEAAKRWGVPWGKIVGESRVHLFEDVWQCKCGTCGDKFITVKVTSECPTCQRKRSTRFDGYRFKRQDKRLTAKD